MTTPQWNIARLTSLVAADAGGDAVDLTAAVASKVVPASLRLRYRSGRRFADEGRRVDCIAWRAPATTGPGGRIDDARASPVRAGARSSGGAASARCSTSSPASQAAVSSGRSALSSCAVVSPGMSTVKSGRLGGAKPDGRTAALSSPATSRHGAWPRRRATTRHGSTTTAVSSSVASPLLPRSGRSGLLRTQLRPRRPETHNSPCRERPRAVETARLAQTARLDRAPRRHGDVILEKAG